MFDLKGKLADAKVFTDLVDDKAIGQIIQILNSPIVENQKVRIMPDCHAGAGCVIGTTMTIGDKVCPNIVGVDIGCGMTVLSLGKREIDLERLDEACHNVPSGHDTWLDKEKKSTGLWKKFLKKEAENFLKQLRCYPRLNDVKRLEASLGSLGGGNHFIECDKDKDGNLYLVIHSGSRNLGKQVAEIYQEEAFQDINDFRGEIQKVIDKLKSEGRQREIQKAIEELKLKTPRFSKDTAYLEGEHLDDYLHDMKLCQEFASASRKIMMATIVKGLLDEYKDKDELEVLKSFEVFETIHNYINFNDNILRKGAVSARKDEKLIIPMNMRDGSLICIGKGNPDWNYSAPHGAGRLLSRSEAKDTLRLEDFESSMEGIYTTSLSTATIDEAPMVYKPMESILENIGDTVDVVNIIKPIYNFKASD